MFLTMKFNSPFGTLHVSASSVGISSVLLPDRNTRQKLNYGKTELLEQAAKELDQYFHGSRKSFSVPLDLSGTEFQMNIWLSLKKIKYGKTTSYGKLAERIGNPKAARAVGGANALNPIPVFLPCHRVVGANGSLTGYGGGRDLLYMKRGMLDLEKINC